MKVTVNNNGQSKDYFFNKQSILIGRSEQESEDLIIEDSSFRPDHLKIFNDRGIFIVINQTHDPHTTINGRPFGKRELKKGDRIQVGSTEIIFQGALLDAKEEKEPMRPDRTEPNIQEGVRGIDEGTRTQEEKDPEPTFSLPRESEAVNPESSSKSKFLASRNFLGIGLLILVIIGSIGCSILYEIIRERSKEQEIRAAQGIADVAMALAFSQINQIKPHHHNWSDPEFLRESMNQLLPESYTPLFDLDADGAFHDNPYILRVYTSADLSQFVLIAQPAPNFYNWLIPKSILLLDSHEMMIRKTKNLREINRLLVNLHTLENVNSHELSHLIRKEEIVPLSFLADEIEHREFIPPRELTYLKRNAEDYVYNAPRYYKLSGLLLEQLIRQNVSFERESSEPLASSQIVDRFDKLKDFVIYVPGGIESAIQIQNRLGALHKKDLLLGYLTFHPENQGIDTSNLLLLKERSLEQEGERRHEELHHSLTADSINNLSLQNLEEAHSDEVGESETAQPHDEIAETGQKIANGIDQINEPSHDEPIMAPVFFLDEGVAKLDLETKPDDFDADPLKKEIHDLVSQRTRALQPLSQCIADLLLQNNEKSLPYFSETLYSLLKLYETVEQYQNEQIAKAIPLLVSNYASEEKTERDMQFEIWHLGVGDYKENKIRADSNGEAEEKSNKKSLTQSLLPNLRECIKPIGQACVKQALGNISER
jgi:hypothetical protein